VAEDKANNVEATQAAASGAEGKSKILMGLVIINMLVVFGVGFMLWKSKHTQVADPNKEIEQVIEGEKKTQEGEKAQREEIGKVVPLETFIVNLAGSKGRKVLKVNMELEVKGADVIQEIDNRKAQIRDFIIIILSSKTFEEVSTKEGKDHLRNEIKDNINTFLVKGKVSNVYFTELIYN
jgi:flagellar FliL protein